MVMLLYMLPGYCTKVMNTEYHMAAAIPLIENIEMCVFVFFSGMCVSRYLFEKYLGPSWRSRQVLNTKTKSGKKLLWRLLLLSYWIPFFVQLVALPILPHHTLRRLAVLFVILISNFTPIRRQHRAP